MNNSEINCAIAKVLGWTEIEPCTCCEGVNRGWPPGQFRFGYRGGARNTHKKHLPDFYGDLNACAVMEESLSANPPGNEEYSQLTAYHIQLERITGAIPYSAMAPQRCEAFLLLKGLWLVQEGPR